MSRIDHRSLLLYLQEPHSAHEVAEHFIISERSAKIKIQEAIKVGQIIILKNTFLQIKKSANGKISRIMQPLYISRNNKLSFDDLKRFKLKGADDSFPKLKNKAFSAKIPSSNSDLATEDRVNQELSDFTKTALEKEAGSNIARHAYRIKGIHPSEFDLSTSKVRLSSRRAPSLGPRLEQTSSRERINSLSHVERIHLLQALFKKPLTFLELHGRFGISRQMIRGLLKNDVIAETWASKGIGVRFRLTKKGEAYLRDLEAASEFEPSLAKKGFVRLKQRTSFKG